MPAFIVANMQKGGRSCDLTCATAIRDWMKTLIAPPASSSVASSSKEASSSSIASSSSPVSSSSSNASAKVIYAINMGGGEFTDSKGQIWEAEGYLQDVNATGGQSTNGSNDIVGTTDDTLYGVMRWGKWKMELPVSNGEYNVTIRSAETYFDASGKRVMTVTAEGVDVVRGLDLFAVVGKYNAYETTANNISVADGVLTLVFDASVDNATIGSVLVTSKNGMKVIPPAPTKEIDGVRFEPITCGAAIAGTTKDFFSPATSDHWGWNHIAANQTNYSGLKSDDRSVYDTADKNQKAAEPECNGDLTLRRTLVRKYHEPTNQHANGLGIDGTNMPSLDQVKDIVMDLKLGSRTHVPTRTDHHDGYSASITVDTGARVKLIKIDNRVYKDRWIRITLPASALGTGRPGKMQYVAELNNFSYGGGYDFLEVDLNIHRMTFVMK